MSKDYDDRFVNFSTGGFSFNAPHRELQAVTTAIINFGLDGLVKLERDNFMRGLPTSSIYASLAGHDPTNAPDLYKRLIHGSLVAETQPILQSAVEELSDVALSIRRLKALVTATDLQRLNRGTHLELYQRLNIDHGYARKLRLRGRRLQEFELQCFTGSRSSGEIYCSYLGTSCCPELLSFNFISHVYFVLDDLEDPEHVFWLLSNRIIAYAGKIQRYGNFEVDEARTLVNGLKKRKIDWISLLNVDVKGVEPVSSNSNLFPDSDQEDDRPDDSDESNGIRIHGDESGESPNDSKNEEDANQKEDKKDPVKRPMLSEELIESASKLRNQFYDSFNFLRELKRMIYKFELCEETQICQRLNRAVDEVFEGFDNLAHLIQTVKELCVQKRLTDC